MIWKLKKKWFINQEKRIGTSGKKILLMMICAAPSKCLENDLHSDGNSVADEGKNWKKPQHLSKLFMVKKFYWEYPKKILCLSLA